ncbi:uncharacterized protein EV154DRAFT_576212 [Mucor mucedo]|uniref:uncharacterized protein n=1 Tax=Mucor mucedo TaxID=29922 RepID=UPI002220B2CD|nr:uncharacterized protein EV154DRAFT_576212 [Mucor mucedo]KAI7879322.1 hypothetical protein EV154DRAFT_576212 [Mucor mucedo]
MPTLPSGTSGNSGSNGPATTDSQEKNDPMLIDFPELDSPSSSNTVHNTFDENAVQVLKRIGNCNARLAALFDREDSIMDLETTTMEEFNLREAKVRSLKHDITYWKNQLVDANLLYTSFKETSVSHISHLANVMKLDDSDKALTKPKDHSDIPAKEIPVFDVKYTDLDTNPDIHSTDDYSLKSFIRKFERAYKNYDVDVEVHWLFHLEASFENNDLYCNWFQQNFKAIGKGKKKSWSDAKKILEHRFDAAARLGLIKVNFMLHSMRQSSHEQLAEYMDRFGACLRAAKVHTHENFYFSVAFLSSLFTKEFQDKVQEKLYEYMKEQLYTMDSSMASKYATHNETQFYEFYSNFGRLGEALNHYLGNLESTLKEIQVKNSSSAKSSSSSSSSSPVSSSSSSNSSSRESNKKRRMDDKSESSKSSINFERLFDPTYVLNDQERTHMRKQLKCLSCRVARFTPDHLKECAERKKFLANKVKPTMIMKNSQMSLSPSSMMTTSFRQHFWS